MSGSFKKGLISFLRFIIYRSRLYVCIEYFDFVLLLNVLKHLPVVIAEPLVKLRGMVRYCLDLDWKSTCLGYPYMVDKTRDAISQLINLPPEVLDQRVLQRFQNQSREEYEAKLFSLKKTRWPKEVLYENISLIDDLQKQGRGVILLTAHFDSCVAGSTFIGDLGYDVNIFYDDIVFDSRVKPFLQDFFRDKYAGMKGHYNSGTFISKKDMRDIYRRLSKGQVFIWLSDVLNTGGNIEVDFIGGRYLTTDNVLRIAFKTASAIGAYVTLWQGKGIYKTIFLPPLIPSMLDNPEEVIKNCYAFLSRFIMQDIERWWIVDTSLDFKKP